MKIDFISHLISYLRLNTTGVSSEAGACLSLGSTWVHPCCVWASYGSIFKSL